MSGIVPALAPSPHTSFPFDSDLSGCPARSAAESFFSDLYVGWKLVAYYMSGNGDHMEMHLAPERPAICPKCGAACTKIHSVKQREIRELPFPGSTQTRLHVAVRRVRCKCGCCQTEELPWVRPKKRMTKRLEAAVQALLRWKISVSEVAQHYELDWESVRRLDEEQLEAEFSDVDVSNLQYLAIDEFALHKGHRYATVFMDLAKRQVVYVVKGKSKEAVREGFKWLQDKGVADRLKMVAVDMNACFPTLVKEYFPKAEVVFDLFHVMQNFTRDVAAVARKHLIAMKVAEAKKAGGSKAELEAERRVHKKLLRCAEWLLVKPAEALTTSQRERYEQMMADNELLAALGPTAELLRAVWTASSKEEAARLLQETIDMLEAVADKHSFVPAKKFARLLRNHQDGIIAACRYGMGTNALEGANNKIKVIKRIGFGFRKFEYFALKIKSVLPGLRKLSVWAQYAMTDLITKAGVETQRLVVSYCARP